ncbi:hypothetical protein [Streptomyces alboflavus]|uniref:hypothetical protein n=1 Tax=Streptomyces alboflavus TaxID=67267 RepID=UPI001F3AD564|nr:hypothetical protein [Streptomyces alboflavus]
MQRSTTASVLLVSTSVAVLALSGCMGVERGAAGRGAVSAGPATPARAPSGRPPRAVQDPARDSLERGGPADTPSRTAFPRAQATPSDRPSTASPSPSPTDDATAREHGRHSGSFDPPPHHQDGRPQAPARDDERAPRSDAPPPALVEVDLCVLGRAHGGWEPDSKEAAICRAAYGR